MRIAQGSEASIDVESPHRLLDAEHLDGAVFSGGWVSGSDVLQTFEPATGELLATVGSADAAQVGEAVRSAARAQIAWAGGSSHERAEVLAAARAVIVEHRGELVRWLVAEGGSTRSKAEGEVDDSAAELDAAAEAPRRQLAVDLSEAGSRSSVAVRVPVGVVGVITPWNFPLLLALRSVAPALAYGNAVVLKCDPDTPVSGGLAVARIFELAGLPDGVLHVLPGGAEAGAALTTEPAVGMVSFTGSTEVGRIVARSGGEHLKRVALELGGKNAVLVLEDADVDGAARCAAWGSFFNQGQICMSTGRHLVHERVLDRYVDRLVAEAGRLRVGDPLREEVDLGPMINATQFSRAAAIVADSVAAGASTVRGGGGEKPYFPPTVLTEIRPDMRVWREEIFGPVAPVLAFADVEEAIALANDTRYGLSAGIFTSSLDTGRRVAARLRTGMVHVNDQTVDDNPRAPMGGMGDSGNGGRFGVVANEEEFTQWRWLTERESPVPLAF